MNRWSPGRESCHSVLVSIEGRVCGVHVPRALIINCSGGGKLPMSPANGRWTSMIYFQAFVFRTPVRRLSIFMSLLDMRTPVIASFSTLDSLWQRLHIEIFWPDRSSSIWFIPELLLCILFESPWTPEHLGSLWINCTINLCLTSPQPSSTTFTTSLYWERRVITNSIFPSLRKLLHSEIRNFQELLLKLRVHNALLDDEDLYINPDDEWT